MKIKRLACILLILVITISIVACSVGSKVATGEKQQEKIKKEKAVDGGEITVPITNVKTLNPLLSTDSSLYYFNKLIFEGLFGIDKNLNIKNILAEKYTIENNGQSINIKLRENVKWHDGTDFTSEDVKFTIDTLKYGSTSSKYSELIPDLYSTNGVANIQKISSIEVHDIYNITINFSETFSDVLETLTFPIVPKHRFTGGGDVSQGSYDRALSLQGYNPIGTGPYKKTKYEKLKSVKLDINDEYWGEKPHIQRIIGKILKDEKLSLVSFDSGQVNIASSLGIDWESYAQNESVKKYEFPSRNYEFLAFNFKDELFQDEKGKALRKAIAYGIDRDTIVEKVYLKHATKADVPIHPDSWLLSKKNITYKYNVKKARKILESAGWTDKNEDGIYEDENGKKLTIKITTNSSNQLRMKTTDIIASNLKSIGIEVEKDYKDIELENVTEETELTDWQQLQSKLTSGNYQVAVLGWELSYIPDISFMFHSSGTDNFINYNNEKMDDLLNNVKSSISREEKKKAYAKLQKYILDELPYVSLFFTNGSILGYKRVEGDIQPSFVNVYDEIQNWYIPKKFQNSNK
ncbi:oligopeptide ABC transport system substrate binding protein AppA [Gottschalkia purinilytica]|uniref:Oligopeptide ABC transport system substrate binding protein AppA n=1 Tax=Gottschalkia purinilytica TaxID=1503 RepID=A0A0L0WDD2_GOTPU|nr:peptide ABC transporter substrate-binding protein [Gottschalkia purinilytica]KNF09473.1 oligopeptide ABC transport system substrate binding protein AppA [Gottschalkia purinilytica]